MDYVAKSNFARRKDYLNALEKGELNDGDSGETPANTSDN
jgi:hypothetical protein